MAILNHALACVSLLGLLIFVLSGFGDLIWHELFGFEHDLEALLSPTHLVLALGGTLMIAGPFRSAWQRPDHPSALSLASQWPMLLSLTLLLSILTFFTQFAHPFVEAWLVQDIARWDLQREIFVMQADGSGQTRLDAVELARNLRIMRALVGTKGSLLFVSSATH